MIKRLIRWATYGIFFGLIPLMASVLIHFFLGKLSFETFARSPEILFFSLLVNATCLGELTDVGEAKTHDNTLLAIKCGLSCGVVVCAILYGAFLFASTAGNVPADFAARVFYISLILATASLFVSTTGQVFLALVGK